MVLESHLVSPELNWLMVQMEVGFWTAIRRQFPRMCWCLVYVGVGRQTCLICSEEEDWSFVRCPTKGCKGVYCVECWRDVHVRISLSLSAVCNDRISLAKNELGSIAARPEGPKPKT